MNSRTQNQLNMIGACINVAQSPDYKPVWEGKEPADFAIDIATLQTDYGTVTVKAAQADSATGGAADAKSLAETALEDAAYILARALAIHLKKIGDLDRHGKVDVSKSEIVKLRNQELVNKATAIRDLGLVAAGESGAAGRGVTVARHDDNGTPGVSGSADRLTRATTANAVTATACPRTRLMATATPRTAAEKSGVGADDVVTAARHHNVR